MKKLFITTGKGFMVICGMFILAFFIKFIVNNVPAYVFPIIWLGISLLLLVSYFVGKVIEEDL